MKWYKQLILATCIGMAFNPVSASAETLDRIVAVVDSDVVTASQLQERLAMVRRKLRQRDTELPPEDALTKQVLEKLIIESLQLQMGDRANIRINEQTLGDTVNRIAQRNNMSLSEFQQALAQDGISFEKAREQIRRDLIINRVRKRRVADRIQVTQQEIKNFLQSEQGKYQLSADYRLGHILIALPESATPNQANQAKQKATTVYQKLKQGANFGQVAVAVSDGQKALEGGDLGWRKANQLPSLFANQVQSMNKGDISKPIRSPSGFHIIKLIAKRGGQDKLMQTQFKARHILLKPSEIRSEKQTKALADRLYLRLENGEDFTQLAKAFSDDSGSALNGGSLDWVNPNDMVPAFRDKLSEVSVNTISKPFKSRYGWHILQVLDTRQQDMSKLVQENRARIILRNRKYEEELQNWLRQIRAEAYVEIKL
ncbi:peptidylprolyl isomerase [Endozoicomonas sp. SM1973]|uniref:Chaperone SurA n=1 Tax=Spartinivicinus marinus TaxID=2994442 RepID=A0A853I6H1_9GAMM|nr:peptidylprolyl isomerase [Spartinivicinus marinus]MCX4028025.1 peptidylprolyl isomerase [Spartinivicinus marinus]NYZ68349.1 peptidylprolyl isomerase [Spartinivicinus marinus]